jgi:hypothetical protein
MVLNNKFIKVDEKQICSTCKTDCLEDAFGTINISFKNLPSFLQQKIELFKKTIIEIDKAINNNDLKKAQSLKEKAYDEYIKIFMDVKNNFGETSEIATEFYQVIELILRRHTDKKAYDFLNS